ncbi:MAG: hypothetical protein U0V04_03275 [Spirosomataceae bacterium]|jgi:hypothetical protein
MEELKRAIRILLAGALFVMLWNFSLKMFRMEPTKAAASNGVASVFLVPPAAGINVLFIILCILALLTFGVYAMLYMVFSMIKLVRYMWRGY